ncbi:MAG: sigma-70 family RNA polymerase sigma factor [Betaproteobacteria bacterium]|nr:sigma-70 family RNA polymerase sigma factor [Betaproteobacteria bacterium]
MPPRSASTDAELILAAAQGGDREAFAELVRRHQSMVRSVLRRLTNGDAALADDLAQEAFLLAWRRLDTFRFEARFTTWLYRIAFNAWQSERRKTHEVLLGEDEAMPEPDAAPSGPGAEERMDLERALATLPDAERAAIAACYAADLSHVEAAEALGIPLGTVKTHILRAKERLRARLVPKKETP